MKKILGVLFIAVISLVCFSGCFSNSESVDKIEIESYPKSTYVIDEAFDWSNLKVKVTLKDNTVKTVEGNPANWTDANFKCSTASTSNEGTYSVTVSYGETLKATFQYTVLKSYFANGNGTKENPFQISTLTQFKSIVRKHSTMTYYVLINDIDFESNYVTPEADVSNISLDGQGYAFRNLNTGVFNVMRGDTIIENLNVYANMIDAATNGVFSSYEVGNYHIFRNINFYGLRSDETYNCALFGYSWSESVTCVYENINNYMDFINSAANGIFSAGSLGLVYLINCTNYGTLISPSSSLITSNVSLIKGTYVIKNMRNYGDVISTLVKTDVLWAAPTSAGITTIPNYDPENSNYKYYNYNENLGYMMKSEFTGYTDVDKLSITDVENIKVKKFEYVPSVITVENSANNGLQLKATVDNEEKLQNKSLKIKVVISSHVFDTNGNYQVGHPVWEHVFVSTAEKTALELFNEYELQALLFVNTEQSDKSGVKYIDGNTIESEKDGLQIVTISGSKYYVYDSTRTPYMEGTHSFSYSDKATYTIIVLDGNDRPISSTMFIKK